MKAKPRPIASSGFKNTNVHCAATVKKRPTVSILLVPVALLTVVSAGCRQLNELQLSTHEFLDTASVGMAEISRVGRTVRGQLRENEQKVEILVDRVQVLSDEASELVVKGTDVATGLDSLARRIGNLTGEVEPMSAFLTSKGPRLMDDIQLAVLDFRNRTDDVRNAVADARSWVADFFDVQEDAPARTIADYEESVRGVATETREKLGDYGAQLKGWLEYGVIVFLIAAGTSVLLWGIFLRCLFRMNRQSARVMSVIEQWIQQQGSSLRKVECAIARPNGGDSRTAGDIDAKEEKEKEPER